jgi:hypothetical protein
MGNLSANGTEIDHRPVKISELLHQILPQALFPVYPESYYIRESVFSVYLSNFQVEPLIQMHEREAFHNSPVFTQAEEKLFGPNRNRIVRGRSREVLFGSTPKIED